MKQRELPPSDGEELITKRDGGWGGRGRKEGAWEMYIQEKMRGWKMGRWCREREKD